MVILLSVLIGLGIFLFGMRQLESGLQSLGSDRIRRWLGRSTRHPISSVATGTAITAVLQSSSMVSLIVLAFASSGMIPLFNAVGVILGANLGTTFTGWVVATIGFKMDLEAFALPFFGLGALVLVFSKRDSRYFSVAGIVMGLGLLIFGLSQMKEAVEDLPRVLSSEFLKDLSLPMFLLIGMLLTAVIQSSSAMTLVALTALNAGIIDLASAGALIVGADIGTTSTTALGSIKSAPVAKQLALAHVSYNLVVDAIAFIAMIPLLPQALVWLGIEDPLYGLVLFHSAFNLIGLFIFVPFLKPFSRWLSGFFQVERWPNTRYLHVTSPKVQEAAIVALKNELKCVLTRVFSVNLRNLKIDPQELQLDTSIVSQLINCFPSQFDYAKRYDLTKQLEGEMFYYAGEVGNTRLDEGTKENLSFILDAARDGVYAMKVLKDERKNLIQFRLLLSDIPEAHSYYEGQRRVYEVLLDIVFNDHQPSYIHQKLAWLREYNERLHTMLHDVILHHRNDTGKDGVKEGDNLASMLNTNREIWHANKSLFEAVEHCQKWKTSEDK